MSLTRAARTAVVLGLAGLVLAGCPSWPGAEPCGQLPDVSACPLGRGGTCDDRECTALYDCVNGGWTLVKQCPLVVAATQEPDASTAPEEAECSAMTIDRSGEAWGCEPDLQEPDCPASAAEGCSPCLTGCVDFFLCTTPGWQVVAHCDEDGRVKLEP